VTGWLTAGDSTLDCRQFEQMAGASVNVKSSGHYSQPVVVVVAAAAGVGRLYRIRVRTIEGRRGHTLDIALDIARCHLIRVCLTRDVIAHGGPVSSSLLPRKVFNGPDFLITTIVMALEANFPRVDATLAQLRGFGEAVQIITGRKGAVCDFITRTLAVRGKTCCSLHDNGQIKRTEKNRWFLPGRTRVINTNLLFSSHHIRCGFRPHWCSRLRLECGIPNTCPRDKPYSMGGGAAN